MTTEKNSGGPPPIVAMTAAEPAHHSAAARLRNYFLTSVSITPIALIRRATRMGAWMPSSLVTRIRIYFFSIVLIPPM